MYVLILQILYESLCFVIILICAFFVQDFD